MADVRVTNEFCSVVNNGEPIINQFYVNARVESPHTIVKVSTLNGIPVGNVPALPTVGELCEKDKLYAYNNQVIQCLQTHNRTIYNPEDTPALFAFYRANTSGLEWVENELVQVDWERTYQGNVYKVLQQHMTQQAWNPIATLGTLWQAVQTGTEWQIGVLYHVNDIVTYQGHTYKCLQQHTSQAGWTPPVVPALWQLVS